MPSRLALVALVALTAASPLEAAEPPQLARARTLYNSGDYDGAIAAAAMARQMPSAADAAALVIARAHLERFRRAPDPADLSAARDALGAARPAALTPRDQVDLFVGLGQSLFLSDAFGAAAELFDAALGRSALLPGSDRAMLLDWWATALDREAQRRHADRRLPVYARLAGRMADELKQDPGIPPANYWLAVALRGLGDVDGAWDAVVAGWVRSTLRPDASAALRADLDKLVNDALIPERANARPAAERPEALMAFHAEWERLKTQWK